MSKINLDRGWRFNHGVKAPFQTGASEPERTVDLPHDYMIESDPYAEAPSGGASGFYNAGVGQYRKEIMIPAEWENELVSLRFDGVMMNATLEVNGSKVLLQHYGYAPFVCDITPYLYFGEENSIVITANPSMQPNSRWYSGAGIFRSVSLVHTPKLCIAPDGIFLYTKEIEYDEEGTAVRAFIKAAVDVENHSSKNVIAEVSVTLCPDGSTPGTSDTPGPQPLSRRTRIQVHPNARETAFLTITVESPDLWDAEHPNLYTAEASVSLSGEFRTHFLPASEEESAVCDTSSVLFGIREIRADAVHGLRINGKTVKLKGGCLHHDNGPLGAVSLYDSEYRKLSILKSIGFNAVRTTHNPPSAAFIEACDRLGIYVFDEAFDAWSMGKQAGDYNQYFETDWQKDLTAFVRRDRSHPSVIIWSTGNEITERGGLGDGYTLSGRLAALIHALDPSRPVSNGICSFWNGLDAYMTAEIMKKMQELRSGGLQNADLAGAKDMTWEEYTEAFTNGLDIVGYNYLEDKYEQDHKRFPERVILGSENFPNEIGIRWPMVENTPYVIGDFTWTAFDYIGEAGIGKSFFFDPDDPALQMGPFALSSHASGFPWRLANDADVDICGHILPQGVYRRIVYGSPETAVFSYDPAVFGKKEVLSRWGFTAVQPCWNWPGAEGKPVSLAVFSSAEEAELFINGISFGRKKAGEAPAAGMPNTFVFDAVFEPGKVEAVSYREGKEISRDVLVTADTPAGIRLLPEKTAVPADGHSVLYVPVEIVDKEGRAVPDAEIPLAAAVSGNALRLAAFGSGNPVTDENYTSGAFRSFRGRALAVLRAGYECGEITLTVVGKGLGEAAVRLKCGE